MTPSRSLSVFFGHHKCATSWVCEILMDVARRLHWSTLYAHNDDSFEGDLAAYVEREQLDLLLYVNANIERTGGLKHYRGIHLIRDPRDLIVSGYYSHLGSHEDQAWLTDHRNKLKALSKDEGLIAEMDFDIMQHILGHIRTWDYEQADVLELRMETLIAEPEKLLLEAFTFLGLVASGDQAEPGALPQGELRATIHDHRFASKAAGRSAGQEDTESHYRKGISGDWVNHFTPVHRDHFKRLFPGLLEELGYEANDRW